ncbi:MAG: methyltransferase [Deltaproteobacteria bacterium]|nr:methyltransferase [Deltaproteobacteria bacterium]
MDGQLELVQPQKGQRFSVDALLLAGFSRLEPGQTALDLGAGNGVAAILVSWAFPGVSLVALELQPGLARLAWRNVWRSGLEDRIRVWQGDLRRADLFPARSFEAVITNPPYRPLGAGRLSPSQERNLARHELKCTLADWTQAAARWLKPGGRLFAVYPVWRLAALLAGLQEAGLGPKRLRLVYDRPQGQGRLALVEARLGGGEELSVSPPLFIHAGVWGQDWSPEMDQLLAGRLLGAI